jgi:hypothetical protein
MKDIFVGWFLTEVETPKAVAARIWANSPARRKQRQMMISRAIALAHGQLCSHEKKSDRSFELKLVRPGNLDFISASR